MSVKYSSKVSIEVVYFSAVSKQRVFSISYTSQKSQTNRSVTSTVEVMNTMTGSGMNELTDGWMDG